MATRQRALAAETRVQQLERERAWRECPPTRVVTRDEPDAYTLVHLACGVVVAADASLGCHAVFEQLSNFVATRPRRTCSGGAPLLSERVAAAVEGVLSHYDADSSKLRKTRVTRSVHGRIDSPSTCLVAIATLDLKDFMREIFVGTRIQLLPLDETAEHALMSPEAEASW